MSETPQDETSLEWSPDELRRLGHELVDRIADRWAGLRDDRPWRGAARDEIAPVLDRPCPEDGRPIDQVMEEVLDQVLPLAGRIDHPRFMAFIPSSPTLPALLGDWLASGYNVFQGTWLASAGPSQVELTVLEWFREWMGMPEGASGLFTSGGSAANLLAVVAAREAAGSPTEGVAWVGDQSHSSVPRALRIAGFDESRIRRIPSGPGFRMDVERLCESIQEERGAGRTPVLIAANAGATNTGAVDPLPQLARIAAEADAWFHVDAAYGGFGVLDPTGAAALEGIGLADSVTLDPHKWLFQTFEAGCLLVRDPALLTGVFRVMPEYLQDVDLGLEQVNFADRGLQLTRRFRALGSWMTVQSVGREGLAAGIGGGIRRAEFAQTEVEGAPELELLSEASLGIVCFRAVPSEAQAAPLAHLTDAEGARRVDDWNRRIQDRVVAEGTAMISSTRLHERFSLRICPMNYRTTTDDVAAVLRRIRELARELPVIG